MACPVALWAYTLVCFLYLHLISSTVVQSGKNQQGACTLSTKVILGPVSDFIPDFLLEKNTGRQCYEWRLILGYCHSNSHTYVDSPGGQPSRLGSCTSSLGVIAWSPIYHIAAALYYCVMSNGQKQTSNEHQQLSLPPQLSSNSTVWKGNLKQHHNSNSLEWS